MAWGKKKASGAKPITKWAVDVFSLTAASGELDKLAGAGHYIQSVTPIVRGEQFSICVISCKKTWPNTAKKAKPEPESEPEASAE